MFVRKHTAMHVFTLLLNFNQIFKFDFCQQLVQISKRLGFSYISCNKIHGLCESKTQVSAIFIWNGELFVIKTMFLQKKSEIIGR